MMVVNKKVRELGRSDLESVKCTCPFTKTQRRDCKEYYTFKRRETFYNIIRQKDRTEFIDYHVCLLRIERRLK
jgi:hypothetical protein